MERSSRGTVLFAMIAVVAMVAVIAGIFVTRHHTTPTSTIVPGTSNGGHSPQESIVNINGDVPEGSIAGTGMVLTADGLVLTNNHVVAGTTTLTGQVNGAGTTYDATVIGVDPTHDVAVIRLEGASGLPPIEIESSPVVSIGDRVTAMGNALGRNGPPVAVTGVVTSLDETVLVGGEAPAPSEILSGLIEFDAPLEPGDSGGPLFNEAQHVIGMDTVGRNPHDPNAPKNFGGAIPITSAINIANQIIRGATSPYIQSGHSGSLGVTIAPSGGDGATVTQVEPQGAAANAGIVSGDVITAIGTNVIRSGSDFNVIMVGRRPGDHLNVTWRDGAGQIHQATVSLTPGPPA